MIKVATSGYFDPLHVGHLECIKRSKYLGDKLIVIVNNDYQLSLKKGKPFMPEKERLEIIGSLNYVDEAFLSIDEDRTVIKSLSYIRPNIFTKGGDRFSEEIPEAEVCKRLGIKIIDGLGEKIQSSSFLLENLNSFKYVQKPWGGYQDFVREKDRVVKELKVNPNQSLSLQSHEKREEHWLVIQGHGRVQLENNLQGISTGDYILIKRNQKHRLINNSNDLLRILELQLGECSEEDIFRYEDNYGRDSR